tara:strand:+ start:235 stop:465 length:231 start_codon:yes stop_codon:yes gene_type:complete
MFEKNHLENEDPMWKTHMQTLTKRMRNMEIAQTLDESLHQYYVVEHGKEVPEWRCKKDPEWWTKYLISLGIDPKNP